MASKLVNKKMKSKSVLQPRTTSYEWGGPIGALFMIIFLPCLVIMLQSLCNMVECRGAGIFFLRAISNLFWNECKQGLPAALLLEVMWLTAHAIFSTLPIGKKVYGLPLRNGTVLSYRMNAIHAFVLSHIILFYCHYTKLIDLGVIAHMVSSLTVASIIISTVMSFVLYVASYRDWVKMKWCKLCHPNQLDKGDKKDRKSVNINNKNNDNNSVYCKDNYTATETKTNIDDNDGGGDVSKNNNNNNNNNNDDDSKADDKKTADMNVQSEINTALSTDDSSEDLYVLTALGGNTGNCIYNFWIGRELNPRSGLLDWKMMCELRPGLIGWSILNWSFVFDAMQREHCTASLVLLAMCQSLYVADGLMLEAGNLTMMDIVRDGFGYMLCFGDLTWVPFVYTLQCKYLDVHHPPHSAWYNTFCVLVVIMGYSLFRGANSVKNKFRTNPNDPALAKLKVMKTSKGKSLIISGYWGLCRHPNYVGDWIMSVGWALLTGSNSLIPYFHPLYFGILLIHRQLRDEAQMREKYGEDDWCTFCHHVPYRLIPYIY